MVHISHDQMYHTHLITKSRHITTWWNVPHYSTWYQRLSNPRWYTPPYVIICTTPHYIVKSLQMTTWPNVTHFIIWSIILFCLFISNQPLYTRYNYVVTILRKNNLSLMLISLKHGYTIFVHFIDKLHTYIWSQTYLLFDYNYILNIFFIEPLYFYISHFQKVVESVWAHNSITLIVIKFRVSHKNHSSEFEVNSLKII